MISLDRYDDHAASEMVDEARRRVLRRGDAAVAFNRADDAFSEVSRVLLDAREDPAVGDTELTDMRLAVLLACRRWMDASKDWRAADGLVSEVVKAVAQLEVKGVPA